uniref:Uncharacterized protein n=1 Tax=Anguilla anguilla TaxID=7936 RepID=A0A0E9WXL1_ANGAN
MASPVQCHYFFFSFYFGFFFLNIQIIRTILSCQIKKIYCGSLFFPLPKKVS